jgi:tetratricopeptide (TPR) repeat protein
MNPAVIDICDDILKRDTTGNVPDALLLKGIYFSDIHQYPKALELFEQCIKQDWKFADAHIEMGIVYFEMKDFNKALDAFKISATVENTNGDSYFWMGRTYEQLQMKEQAIESYERALAFKPDIIEAEQALKRLQ